jgi:Cu+-exporting ATPase
MKERNVRTERLLLRRVIAGLFFSIPVLLIGMVFPLLPMDHPIQQAFMIEVVPGLPLSILLLFALTTPVQLFLAAPFYKNAYSSLRYRFAANMDVLIVIGTVVAYVYSTVIGVMGIVNGHVDSEGGMGGMPEQFFDTSALVLTFVLLG